MRLLLLSLAIVLISCAPREVREAQDVVVLADSLREAHLVAQDEYNDSTHLAQAYYTLEKWQWLYPDDFAHACYHYGRILRDKDDPVSAMQVFLAATHSRTNDYHILGRAYSNIGDMAHLAGEFQLSYEMFEYSADMFLKSGDTTTYCYGLNNMAFELAEQGLKNEAYSILRTIDRDECQNFVMATRAVACRVAEQYDSALYYTSRLLKCGFRERYILVIQAQAYSSLGQTDTAVHYAEQVLKMHPTLEEKNNVMYILTNYDKTMGIDAVRQTASNRADAQKVLEIRQGKLSQAVQLLEQDLARKPDMRWLYAIIATILIIGIVNGCIVYKKRKHHRLLSQQIEDLKSQNEGVISQLSIRIDSNIALLSKSHNLKKDLCWDDFELFCQETNQQFNMLASKLQTKQVLNETQIRLCILVLLNLSRSSIAKTLPYAINSIGKLKDQTAKLLGTTGKNLRTDLLQLAIEG
ncbi:MAG: tetratricopeptide repeat protein [Bacteroidales bacterium]|nr:tetratricopeptide repeat protein [Candidatus Colicola caccequi]